MPCLLFLHRRGCVEGDFHHGESSGCAVRRGSNQRPGLQVGSGEDRARPSSSYLLPSLPSAAASPSLGILMTDSQAGWETVGGPREGLREEREGVQVLGWEWGLSVRQEESPWPAGAEHASPALQACSHPPSAPSDKNKTGRNPACRVFLLLCRLQ